MSVEKQFDIDLEAFSLDAVKRAAYRLSDRFAFDVTITARTATCTLVFDHDKPIEFIDSCIAAFRKELLDQDLRQTIRTETAHVRNVILAHAFSRTELVSNEPVQGD